MISLYSGTPGSGKSLHIAQRIYIRVMRNMPTICNFEINRKKIRRFRKRKGKKEKKHFLYCPNDKLTPEYLIELSQGYFAREKKPVREDTILLVIDECQIIFNSRNWQTKDRGSWLSFFSQHRKYGYEIVLVAQFDGMIDKQIRTLIEYECIHRKLSNFGLAGWVMALIYGGKVFVSVRKWYPLNEVIGREVFLAKKKYYSIYDTFATFKQDKQEDAGVQKAPADCSAGA